MLLLHALEGPVGCGQVRVRHRGQDSSRWIIGTFENEFSQPDWDCLNLGARVLPSAASGWWDRAAVTFSEKSDATGQTLRGLTNSQVWRALKEHPGGISTQRLESETIILVTTQGCQRCSAMRLAHDQNAQLRWTESDTPAARRILGGELPGEGNFTVASAIRCSGRPASLADSGTGKTTKPRFAARRTSTCSWDASSRAIETDSR